MGKGAFPSGEACVMYNLLQYLHNNCNRFGSTSLQQEDMSARNDDMSIYEISALNNRPSVSLTVQEEEFSIVMGPDSSITLEADA